MTAVAMPAAAQEKLVVWWVKGFYKSEDDALYEAIKKYEQKSGIKVELSQYAVQDGIPKTCRRSTRARRPTSRTSTCSTSR
jgi:multiple sugar transport system substrate-binding protein